MIFGLFIFVSLFIGVCAFFSTNNIFIALAVFAVFLLYYLLFANKQIKKFNDKIKRLNTCFFFVNTFIITLNIKGSIEESYYAAIKYENKSFREYVDSITSLKIYDRLVYLRKYFNISIYKIFINIIDCYIDQGGNILDLSDAMTQELNRMSKMTIDTVNLIKKRTVEFLVLWFLTFIVIIVIRFSLSQFYNQMVNNNMYLMLGGIFYLFVLFSIHMFISSSTKLNIKEDLAC